MTDINSLFWELLRVTVGTSGSLSQTPSDMEWKAIYDMASKHSLIGVCFAALQRLGADADEGFARIGMSEMLYLTWMGMAAKIQQKNEIGNRQCTKLQARLSAEGLCSAVLKGQGIAQLYRIKSENLKFRDLSKLRQSGDIDMWVKGGFDVLNNFVQRTCPSKDIAYHRFHYDAFSDTEVELHHRPTLMRNLFDNRKLQKWCDSFGADSFVHLDLGFDVPSIEFNRIFILTHIYRHFLFEGVGLRQVMDYYFVLKARNIDGDNDKFLLKEFRLTRFAGALMWVLKVKFGLEDKYLICDANEEEGRFLLDEIEQMGNFGQTDKRYEGKGKTMRFVKHWGHLLMHYPSEVIWSPIWIVYHWFWKRIHLK